MNRRCRNDFGDYLGDFSVPADVVQCAAHAETPEKPGVVQDITVTVWETPGGERAVYRTVMPLEAWKADPAPFADNYLVCRVSQHFGALTGCG